MMKRDLDRKKDFSALFFAFDKSLQKLTVLVEKLQTQERREVGYVKRAHENDVFHNYSTRSNLPKVLYNPS